MVGGGAVARLTVRRADAVAVLRDLHGCPIEFRQRRDQPSNDAGLAHAARMSADHDQSHREFLERGRAEILPGAELQPIFSLFSRCAPASPTASDTLAAAAPEFPRMPHPSRAVLCWAERRPARRASLLLQCARARRYRPARQG